MSDYKDDVITQRNNMLTEANARIKALREALEKRGTKISQLEAQLERICEAEDERR